MIKRLILLVVMLLVSIPDMVSLSNQVFAESVDTAWVRRYNGPADSTDEAYAIAADDSGNVYVTGLSDGIGTFSDYATIKYYPNGDTAWVRRYNGPADTTDESYAIAVDDSGNVYVTGKSWGSGTSADYTTIKYKPDGDTAWVRRYNGPGNLDDKATTIAIDNSNNVYVTGWSWGSGTDYDYATIKYYPNGDTAWVRRYNGPANDTDYALTIAVDGSGNVYATGKSADTGTSYDYATIKYYPNGDTAWVRRYNGPGNYWDCAYAIAVDGSGNVYVTGRSLQGTYPIYQWDFATIKYYPNGDTAWVRRYNGPGNNNDHAYDIAVDSSGNVYVIGSSYGGTGTYYDYATIKYYLNGDTAWVRRYTGPENSYDSYDGAFRIALNGSNNVYVTGWSYGSGTDYDYATIKYYPNGDTAWVRRYNGPANNNDWASAIAVDVSNNVYVTGKSWGSGTSWDYATIKYVQFYSITGKVMDGGGSSLEDSLVFLAGDRSAVDTTDSNGEYEFAGLPMGDYKVFRDSISGGLYNIHLTSDTSGFNFRGYTDVNDSVRQEENLRIFNLSTNYPNPFNPGTVIEYSLSDDADVELIVYNLLGQKVRTLVNEYQTRGPRKAFWNGKDDQGNGVASGIYFYRLQAGNLSQTQRMVLIR